MTTDLDHLEQLHREATQGRRDVMHFDEQGAGDRRHLIMANGEVIGMYDDENVPSRQARANAEASAAAHNAMPGLIAELRALRARVAKAEAERDGLREVADAARAVCDDSCGVDALCEGVRRKLMGHLRYALAKVPR